MTQKLVSEMGYVAFQSQDIECSIQHATEILGLSEVHRSGSSAILSSTGSGKELVYTDSTQNAVDRLGLVAPNNAAIAEIYKRVKAAGYQILGTEPFNDHADSGFVFVGPEGYIFDIYLRRQPDGVRVGGLGPDRFGHINLHPKNLQAMLAFFVDLLDFKVSDIIGDDFAYFLRCNPEHHGIALIKGNGWLHHHAWQVQSVADLTRLADRLDNAGENLLMGPVRHGAGHNIAAYYVEPSGAVVELYADMEMIYDDERPPTIWSRDDRRWATRWSVYDFTEFRSHGIFPAKEPIR